MFAKKKETELEQPSPNGEVLFGEKLDNYKFLKLVQEQKYEQAYELGLKILKQNPSAVSIKKFCMFIEQNQPELKKMVEDEKEEAEYTSDEEEEEEEDDEDEEDDSEESEEDDEESSSSSEQEEGEAEKQEVVEQEKQPEEEKKLKKEKVKCEPHEWTHVCKNPHCPNKKKS